LLICTFFIPSAKEVKAYGFSSSPGPLHLALPAKGTAWCGEGAPFPAVCCLGPTTSLPFNAFIHTIHTPLIVPKAFFHHDQVSCRKGTQTFSALLIVCVCMSVGGLWFCGWRASRKRTFPRWSLGGAAHTQFSLLHRRDPLPASLPGHCLGLSGSCHLCDNGSLLLPEPGSELAWRKGHGGGPVLSQFWKLCRESE
jgi:hypothetical protein